MGAGKADKLFRKLFCRVFCPRCKKPKVRVHVKVGIGGSSNSYVTLLGELFMNGSYPDTDPKRVPFEVTFTDAAGNPGKVDVSAGPPAVTVDRMDIWQPADVQATESGIKGFMVAQGPVGAANITCEVDVDLGAGTKSLVLSGTIERTATEVTGGAFTFGPAQD